MSPWGSIIRSEPKWYLSEGDLFRADALGNKKFKEDIKHDDYRLHKGWPGRK